VAMCSFLLRHSLFDILRFPHRLFNGYVALSPLFSKRAKLCFSG
jgi:hypothetical protein